MLILQIQNFNAYKKHKFQVIQAYQNMETTVAQKLEALMKLQQIDSQLDEIRKVRKFPPLTWGEGGRGIF